MRAGKLTRVICFFLFFFSFIGFGSAGEIATFADLKTKDASGLPVLHHETVTVVGVVAVDSGLWHDSANYFAIIDQNNPSQGMLVFLPGTTLPQVNVGDVVRITGEVSLRGYSTDIGTTVIVPSGPNDVQVLESNFFERPAGKLISTDIEYDVLEYLEGGFVQVEGRLSDYSNTGIVRGFWVDGSSDGNIEDREGTMYVKFYNYAGIDISHLNNGSYVVVTGILVKGNENHGTYYIRPTDNNSIVEIPDKNIEPDMDATPMGLWFEVGSARRLMQYGMIEVANIQTSHPLEREMFPDWHPDGSALIATLGVEQGARNSREAAEKNLFRFNFSGGTEPKQLSFGHYPHAYPRWSEDASKIAYSSAQEIDEAWGTWDIFTWDFVNEPIQITDNKAFNLMPTWSPSGDSLIYVSNITGKWELWWQSLNGERAQLTSGIADVLFPDWSKDGLLFQKRGDDGRFEIWRAEIIVEGGVPSFGELVCLTENMPGSNVYPRWSPLSDSIAFMSTSTGSWSIWTMDADGMYPKRITRRPGDYLYPAWHPNGRMLAVVSDEEYPTIFMVDIPTALQVEEPEEEFMGIETDELLLEPSMPESPVQEITWPLFTQPALVTPGQNVTITLRDNPGKGAVVSFSVGSQWVEVPSERLDRAIKIQVPDDIGPGTYDVRVQSSEIDDMQPRSLVVREVSSNILLAIVTDIHPDEGYSNPDNPFVAIVQKLNEIKPDFAVLTGDLVGVNADTYHRDYPELYTFLLEEAKFPVFMAMGNHDGKVSGDVSGFTYWQSYFGHLYHTIDIAGWRFVTLNTYDFPQYPSDNGEIGAEQLDWLRGQLQSAQEKGMPVGVFLHHNPFDLRWKFVDEGRKELVDLLEIYGTGYVFAGHRHSDQLEQTATTTIITTRSVTLPDSDTAHFRLISIQGSHVIQLHSNPPKESSSVELND